MKTAILFLTITCMLLGACGGDTAADSGDEALKNRAKVAEANLVLIRDAVLAYHKKNKLPPESITDLDAYGAAESDLDINDDYSELGYTFYNLDFDEAGKMTRGWFIATPISKTGALKVRLNGVSGNFDYVPQGEEFGPAPDDEGWGNEAANTPADNS